MLATPASTLPAEGHVIVVGASARAWAASARRAGWRVHAVDLFADADLAGLADSATRVERGYPAALAPIVAALPPGPLTYTGALENHPALLATLRQQRPLAGVAPETLPRVRTPTALRRLARTAGILFPETQSQPRGVPRDGTWLVKPLRGAGGAGIERWTDASRAPRADAPACWQRHVSGRPCSATYLLAPGGPRLVGVARQRLGPARPRGAPFGWRGGVSLAEHRLPEKLRGALERLGGALWRIDGLRGIVGADFVIDTAGAVVLIEVNPRPTASSELHERHSGESLAGAHLACFGHGPRAAGGGEFVGRPPAHPGAWAKALLRHHRPLVADRELVGGLAALAERWARDDGGWPPLADIPAAGTAVPAHAPLLTVFAHGAGANAAGRILARRASAVRALVARGVGHR